MWLKYLFLGVLVIAVIAALLNFQKTLARLAALREFIREVSHEMRKVTWPTRDEVVSSTLLVLMTAVIVTVMVGTIDSICGKLVRVMF